MKEGETMFDETTNISVIQPRIDRIRAWLESKNLGALFVYSPPPSTSGVRPLTSPI